MILIKQDQAVLRSEGPEKRELGQMTDIYFQQLNGTVYVAPRVWAGKGRIKPRNIMDEILLKRRVVALFRLYNDVVL